MGFSFFDNCSNSFSLLDSWRRRILSPYYMKSITRQPKVAAFPSSIPPSPPRMFFSTFGTAPQPPPPPPPPPQPPPRRLKNAEGAHTSREGGIFFGVKGKMPSFFSSSYIHTKERREEERGSHTAEKSGTFPSP